MEINKSERRFTVVEQRHNFNMASAQKIETRELKGRIRELEKERALHLQQIESYKRAFKMELYSRNIADQHQAEKEVESLDEAVEVVNQLNAKSARFEALTTQRVNENGVVKAIVPSTGKEDAFFAPEKGSPAWFRLREKEEAGE